jgi:hypothetical protein
MAEEQYQKTIPFIQNPIAFIKEKYQASQNKKLSKYAITQDKYFAQMIGWIANTQNQLLIYGYDRPFMELKEIRAELIHASTRRDYHKERNKIIISAIMPKGLECGILEELNNETDLVSILRINGDFSRGYLIHDDWGVNLWDSKKLTPHPIEKKSGIIRRYANIDIISNNLANKMIKNHQKLEQSQKT